MFRRTKGQTEGVHPWGITSSLGENFTLRGQLHPWESNIAPRVEVESWSLYTAVQKLKKLACFKGKKIFCTVQHTYVCTDRFSSFKRNCSLQDPCVKNRSLTIIQSYLT
jgi:hypothetical protein